MIRTDGARTIAHYPPKAPAACPLPTTGREHVKSVRVASNRATTENITALRERYPNADIIIPRRAA
jgi:hypothetical protein